MDKRQDIRLDENDDDVSEIFVGSILKGHCNLLLQLEPTEGSETSSSSSVKLSHTPCVNPKIKKCHQDHGESSNNTVHPMSTLITRYYLGRIVLPAQYFDNDVYYGQ